VERNPDEEVDGLHPAVAVHPSTSEDVASILVIAAEEGLAVVPKGGGTALHLGNLPERADILLCMRGVRQGIEHSPEDLVATLPAGMTLEEASESLGRHGQLLPLASPLPERATIAGALASGLFGPRRQLFGPPRDWVLGLKVVLPNGDITKAGGRVVKNVAGYDMSKLHLGALGTLGIIVEATFKLTPIPEAVATLSFVFPTLDGALRTAGDILEANLSPSAMVVTNPPASERSGLDSPSHHLLVEFAELREVVNRQLKESRRMAELRGGSHAVLRQGDDSSRLWNSVSENQISGWDGILHASVPPVDLDSFLDAALETLESLGTRAAMIAHPGLGAAYLGLETADAAIVKGAFEEVAAISTSLGGFVVLERALPEVKRDVDVWGSRPPYFDLLARIKAEFDPAGVLNPGRYVGGL
jgi:glycolate oxidase FAD binding subunit